MLQKVFCLDTSERSVDGQMGHDAKLGIDVDSVDVLVFVGPLDSTGNRSVWLF